MPSQPAPFFIAQLPTPDVDHVNDYPEQPNLVTFSVSDAGTTKNALYASNMNGIGNLAYTAMPFNTLPAEAPGGGTGGAGRKARVIY
jgi:hypothetical protein